MEVMLNESSVMVESIVQVVKQPAKNVKRVSKKRSKVTSNNLLQIFCASSRIEELPQSLLFYLASFINPIDLLRLSIVSKCMQNHIDHALWNNMIQRVIMTPGDKLKPRVPRQKVLGELVLKYTCKGCFECKKQKLYLRRTENEHYLKRLCQKCDRLPKFNEIQYTLAIERYGFTRKRLLALNSRSNGLQRLFNLQDIIDAAAEYKKDQSVIQLA